jgi:replication factor A1
MRVCAVSSTNNAKLVFALDRAKKVRIIETDSDSRTIGKGNVLVVSPDQERGDRLVCRSIGSVEIVTEGSKFPSLENLATKLGDARDEASSIMVEVIALSQGTVENVNLKDGSVVKKGELVVGDDTGEMKLVSWRELSEKLVGIEPGERLRVVAVTPKATKMGAWVLQLSSISVVERIRNR